MARVGGAQQANYDWSTWRTADIAQTIRTWTNNLASEDYCTEVEGCTESKANKCCPFPRHTWTQTAPRSRYSSHSGQIRLAYCTAGRNQPCFEHTVQRSYVPWRRRREDSAGGGRGQRLRPSKNKHVTYHAGDFYLAYNVKVRTSRGTARLFFGD